jgi:sensor histidine kinase YesM
MKRKNLIIILSHIFGWLCFFFLPALFIQPGNSFSDFLAARFSQTPLINFTFLILFFYFNAFYLLPKLYFNQKKIQYLLSLSFTVLAFYFLLTKLNVRKPELIEGNDDPLLRASTYKLRQVRPFLLLIISWVISSIIHYAARLRNTEKKLLEYEKEKVKAELAFLNAQINPHFLFNTLNNIYALSISDGKKTSVAILQLSKIIRYITTEMQSEMVTLEKELNCIEVFVELQKLRLSKDTVKPNFEIIGDRFNKKIAPLLLMTFVENVFKHGISNEKLSPIEIIITIKNDRLELFLQNKLYERTKEIDSLGVGISNARKRLMHLYKDQFVLNISNANNLFTVNLNLPV